jgi:calcineurin-like phosphoesterase family protein
MTGVCFTANQHFGHAGIIGLCKRRSRSGDEMDEAMIANWNAVVRPDDDVWHLGLAYALHSPPRYPDRGVHEVYRPP